MTTIPDPHSHRAQLLDLTTKIIVAAVQTGQIEPAALPSLIASVYQALQAPALSMEHSGPEKPAMLVPAVAIKRSVTPDYIICLEDGKKFKSMRAHLRNLGMTPAQYRMKWGLPADYPIVAPNYAASRSTMALLHGLGTANSNRAKLPHMKKQPLQG